MKQPTDENKIIPYYVIKLSKITILYFSKKYKHKTLNFKKNPSL